MRSLRQIARKLGGKRTPDPEGAIAVLQIARRLVKDHGFKAIEALNEAAEKYASPIDPAKAFWAAHYTLTTAGARKGYGYFEVCEAEIDVLLPIFDAAIQSQGATNLKAKKL
ncbi:MAG: hypothetical protein A4E20_11005 [Nitrospira sp. SG-bin2]|uniref:hypothetical protein n=1 Tax=Nitrospira cf. moscoviensis SBR1015 TaxID=96242 RepID=UPI000A0DA8D4|nr:hypothetical protein [Nitrospira cf. moscoviensis SBR1015]OQW34541.1 MAG: hypothetical protein A4E20_11005 [Nitrospira sp. SG-bin2]